MEKEPQPDSLQTVAIKPDYPPSEVYSSEPPPAYHRPKSVAVQVARIIAFTVVAVSIILGGFMLASAYVQANGYRQQELELQLLSETADRLQPEALVQADPQQQQPQAEPLLSEETKTTNDVQDNSLQQDQQQQENNAQEANTGNSNNSNESSNNDSSESDEDNVQFNQVGSNVPLPIDIDDLMSTLMERNQKTKLNCIVDKKRADEIIDHQPKMAQLPFGINIRTDPRFERISGERIAIICESGNVQKISPPEDQEDTVMIQPVMIPIPPQHFQTHMAQMVPQEIHIQTQQQLPTVQQTPYAPFRSMPNRMLPSGEMRPQFVAQPNNFVQQYPNAPQPAAAPQQQQQPPHYMHEMRDDMMMMMPKPQQLPTENRPVFVQEEMRVGLVPPRPQQPNTNMEQRTVFFRDEPERVDDAPRTEQSEAVTEVAENVVEERPQSPVPSPLIQHIIQQIIRQRLQSEMAARETNNNNNNVPSQFEVPPAVGRLPIPLEILRQINRLPGNRGVIVAVSSHNEPAEEHDGEVQIVRQVPRENAQEMNGKQYQETVVPMVQEQQQEDSAEVGRPHFLHPRSV